MKHSLYTYQTSGYNGIWSIEVQTGLELDMLNQFSRTQLLLGAENMDRLAKAKVAIFGIGGVGGYVAEALARSGVGSFVLVDDDKVCLTNLNRQIIATRSTVGKYKVDVMKERMLEINPDVNVRIHKCFFLPENAAEFPFSEYDYILDAVDTVSAKLSLAVQAQAAGLALCFFLGQQQNPAQHRCDNNNKVGDI